MPYLNGQHIFLDTNEKENPKMVRGVKKKCSHCKRIFILRNITLFHIKILITPHKSIRYIRSFT